MGKSEGVERHCCPICGGEITVSDLYQYSLDYKVLKSGKLSKKRTRGNCGPMDVSLAGCCSCGENWNADEFGIYDGKFVDFKHIDEEDE